MIRSFIGLEPPPGLRQALAVQQFLLPLPRAVDPEGFHLTLAFLGARPDHVLEAAHEAFAGLRAPAFEIGIQGFGSFGGAAPRAVHALVPPSAPLSALQARVAQAARRAGCDLPARRFVPHVTLGRFAPPGPEAAMRLERAMAGAMGFRAGPWPVREMVLWRSHLRADGAGYEVLARYPLAGEEGGIS
ncbi:RNA 2',3'-cyclic phosphodiesterase [Pseudogemmobacter sonorensis]|uniref:RNA 2',3'-cyclic phosphodiesterase n=1 Tax=Pseudogemmobacter sonorensis TaxID=2989681 RepID=UPI003691EC9A